MTFHNFRDEIRVKQVFINVSHLLGSLPKHLRLLRRIRSFRLHILGVVFFKYIMSHKFLKYKV